MRAARRRASADWVTLIRAEAATTTDTATRPKRPTTLPEREPDIPYAPLFSGPDLGLKIPNSSRPAAGLHAGNSETVSEWGYPRIKPARQNCRSGETRLTSAARKPGRRYAGCCSAAGRAGSPRRIHACACRRSSAKRLRNPHTPSFLAMLQCKIRFDLLCAAT